MSSYGIRMSTTTVMEFLDLTHKTATTIGAIIILKLALDVLSFVWVMFLRPPKHLVKTYGSWAVITGATDGIGRAMAFELASKGLNLVIIGRNPSKLDHTSHLLKEQFKDEIDVKSVVVDFDKCSKDEVVKAIREGIRGLDVGILINNVGQGYDSPKFLHETEMELAQSLVNVNVGAPTWATIAVLPSMVKKKRGAIVNVGSAASYVVPSFPLYAIYGGTKGYVERFSKSISYEYKRWGIDIQCQIPMYVATKMIHHIKESFFIPSPESYSKASVRWIGYESICVPYWPHYVLSSLIKLIPDWMVDWYSFQLFVGWRNAGLKKVSSNKEDL